MITFHLKRKIFSQGLKELKFHICLVEQAYNFIKIKQQERLFRTTSYLKMISFEMPNEKLESFLILVAWKGSLIRTDCPCKCKTTDRRMPDVIIG